MKKILSFLSILVCGAALFTSCGNKNNSPNDISLSNSSEAFNNWYYVSLDNCSIYNDKSRPFIIDYSTMNSSILCNIPNCSHSSSDCIVNVLKSTFQLPIIYNNCAYYFINSDLISEADGKMELDLSTRIKKYDFNNHTISDIANISDFNANFDQGCYLIGDEYYFTANYGNPRYDELGNVTAHNNGGGGDLFSVDLQNGEVTDHGEIFDYDELKKRYPTAETSTSTYLMGKIDDKLYIRVGFVQIYIYSDR